MGPMSSVLEFQVEDSIKSIAEIGCDGWAINGKYPEQLMWQVWSHDFLDHLDGLGIRQQVGPDAA